MVHEMDFEVDGACRANGQGGAIAAAAVVQFFGNGACHTTMKMLPSQPSRPTNQRAELTGIIMALQIALRECRTLRSEQEIMVVIRSDSSYAIDSMVHWLYAYAANGWVTTRGRRVANIDLLQQADRLDQQLRGRAMLDYVWIPREQNELADRACNEALDEWTSENR